MALTAAAATTVANDTYLLVPPSALVASALNPRKHFDQTKLQELAQTMGNGVGVIEPLVVRASGKDKFEIVAGERRWRAATLANLHEVPVVVKDLTDPQVLELMVIENDAREDINALERAEGYKRLLKFGFDIDKLAVRLGHTRKWVYDQIKLLELVPPAQELLLANRITPAHAILIARLTPQQQADVIDVDDAGRGFDDRRAPLFVREATLLTGAEADAEDEARGRDPYVGYKAKSVRELEAWIAEHCRFDPKTPTNVELFPVTAAAVEEAEKVVFITHNHHVNPDAKDGNTQRIYSTVSWKRADGVQQSKTCDRSVTGVIVVGPGRGEAFKVCVHKECEVHWKAERRAKEKAAKTGSDDSWAKRQAEDNRKRQERYAREEQARAEWTKTTPALIEACAAQIKTLEVVPLGKLVARKLQSEDVARAFALLKAKLSSADDVLRALALAEVIGDCEDDWNAYESFPKMAKQMLGLDVAKVLKAVTTKSQPTPKKETDARKPATKAAKKR